MKPLRPALVGLQALTFFALAVVLWRDGAPRLAASQFMLGLITVLVYA